MAGVSPVSPSLMNLMATGAIEPTDSFSKLPAMEFLCFSFKRKYACRIAAVRREIFERIPIFSPSLRYENRELPQGSSLWDYEKTQVKQIGFALPDTYSSAGFANAQVDIAVADVAEAAPDTHRAADVGGAVETAVANSVTSLDPRVAAVFGVVSGAGVDCVAAAVEAAEFVVLAQQPAYHCASLGH